MNIKNKTTATTIIAFLSFLSASNAGTLIESYSAQLSTRDHYNSSGARLKDAAAIIRQDRANFHKFNKRDAADQSDKFFSSVQNRGVLETLLKRGSSSASAQNSIVNGTPTVTVSVFRSDSGANYINVTVANNVIEQLKPTGTIKATTATNGNMPTQVKLNSKESDQGIVILKWEEATPFMEMSNTNSGEGWQKGSKQEKGVYLFSQNKFYALTLDFNRETFVESGFDGGPLPEVKGSWSILRR